MINRFRSILVILLLNFVNIDLVEASEENKLSHQQVIESATKNYPQILSYYEKVNAAEGTALGALGFFDIKIKSNYADRSRGFYDGKTHDTLLEKELGFMGARVYGGYRKSFGAFPNYEGGSLTNTGGEYRFGTSFSLLKNSTIDQNRLGVILANLGVQESKIQLETIKKEIERDSTKAYWKWIASARIFQIYDDLYQLSIKRQSQLEERLKKGDVAAIIVAENKKNILRRKSALAKARQDFENSAIYLSLFWRNDKGEPIIPKPNQVPQLNLNPHNIDNSQSMRDVETALVNRPELRILKIQKEQNLSNLKYAENLFKPELDVNFESSKDLGKGPDFRAEGNNKVGINFSAPLQFREARGKSAEYESKLKSIKYEQQLLEDKIKAELGQIKIQISSIIEMHDNLVEEAKLAEVLEQSEREKFKHGASNFFLVNLREQDSASSKAAAIEMYEKYQSALADYKMAVFLN